MGDEQNYLKATDEVDSEERDKALWAKSMALTHGAQEKAKYKYIELRVEQLEKLPEEYKPIEYKNNNTDSEVEETVQPTTESQYETEGPGFFSRLAVGDYGLAKTYWLFGVLVGIVFRVAIGMLANVGDKQWTGIIIILAILYFCYSIAVLSGTWNAATRYKGHEVWAILAKIQVVLGVAGIIVGSFALLVVAVDA